jgi:hypothetical protein
LSKERKKLKKERTEEGNKAGGQNENAVNE